MLAQHLHSPAMWAIDEKLRRENPQDEQINVSSNPTHFWKYRFHLPLEELIKAEEYLPDSNRK